MTKHISSRLAWHDNGWNGTFCNHPESNVYCVGERSFLGTFIPENRNLIIEQEAAGQHFEFVRDYIPPCASTSNAFGESEVLAYAKPPIFFKSTRPKSWIVPPASICVWPYEEMYSDDVKNDNNHYDNDARRQRAQAFFREIEPGKSLVFYHANYSNPFSSEGANRYVIVGMARVTSVGDEMFYEGLAPNILKDFAQGMVWQRLVTTSYPDDGIRLPYHRYMDQPELLSQFLYTADHPENFKYATRHINDDEALGMVEHFRDLALRLQALGDRSEDWEVRVAWLDSLIAELWHNRGLFPGMPSLLSHLQVEGAVPFFKAKSLAGQERESHDHILKVLDHSTAPTWPISDSALARSQRRWQLLTDSQRTFVSNRFTRFALTERHLASILKENSDTELNAFNHNPYRICESYGEAHAQVRIGFETIDRGMLPSPELGEPHLVDPDDETRMRALMTDVLGQETTHVFLSESDVLERTNGRLAHLPDWKSTLFRHQHISIARSFLSETLVLREMAAGLYLYLRTAYDDERLVESTSTSLAGRPNIPLKAPLTDLQWQEWITRTDSSIRESSPDKYRHIVKDQATQCAKIFPRPLSVVSGYAGTGKTTVILSLIHAIEYIEGPGAKVILLAPTGKAADRMRKSTGKSAQTVHSFLARLGWLDQMRFLRSGGKRETALATYIIDEASMLNLETVATLFRAIDPHSIRRLVFVGDPHQLPPIGRGRFFADLIEWIKKAHPESHAELTHNVRQLENQLDGKGTGILQLASLFLHGHVDNPDTYSPEEILEKILGGGTIDEDLSVVYWKDSADLEDKLITSMITNMEEQTNTNRDPDNPQRIWYDAFQQNKNPDTHQVITPYRGDGHGTSRLNQVLQREVNSALLHNHGHLGGITAGDKVIQTVNRTQSNPVSAYDFDTRKKRYVEVFNGEIGFTWFPAWAKNAWRNPTYIINALQVRFSRKPHLAVEVPNTGFVEENLELAYAISVHKAQGSEFEVVYFILPNKKSPFLSTELVYTALTRATKRCVVLLQEDLGPLLWSRRPEQSALIGINSSLFTIRIVPEALSNRMWYEEGKIHHTLSKYMVRSKSEVIICNLLSERGIPFKYETLLQATDGTMALPDFTIVANGREWYWEHLGLLNDPAYQARWERKRAWYQRWFPGQLLTTQDGPTLSKDALAIVMQYFQ